MKVLLLQFRIIIIPVNFAICIDLLQQHPTLSSTSTAQEFYRQMRIDMCTSAYLNFDHYQIPVLESIGTQCAWDSLKPWDNGGLYENWILALTNFVFVNTGTILKQLESIQ